MLTLKISGKHPSHAWTRSFLRIDHIAIIAVFDTPYFASTIVIVLPIKIGHVHKGIVILQFPGHQMRSRRRRFHFPDFARFQNIVDIPVRWFVTFKVGIFFFVAATRCLIRNECTVGNGQDPLFAFDFPVMLPGRVGIHAKGFIGFTPQARRQLGGHVSASSCGLAYFCLNSVPYETYGLP